MAVEARVRPPLTLRDVEPTPALETVHKGLRMLSRRVGIGKDIAGSLYVTGDPLCFTFGNLMCDPSRFAPIRPYRDRSGAAGFSRVEALAAALGELVERYCMRLYDAGALIVGSYRDLKNHHELLEPDRARLHSREQVDTWRARSGDPTRYRFFDEDTPVGWTWGYSLTRERWLLIPAALVYIPYHARRGEAHIGWCSSTGLASGNTLEEAILSGLYECVERDAFTICWLNCVMPRRIIVDDPRVDTLLRERFGVGHPAVDLRLFDTTLDIPIPSVFALMRRPLEFGPSVAAGAAARLSQHAALRKALIEAAQCCQASRFFAQEYRDWQPRMDFSDVTRFEDHAAFYLKRPDLMSEAFAFLNRVEDAVRYSDLPDHRTGSILGDLRRCVDWLDKAGYETIVTDLTTEDVAEAGFRVVRVVVPGLQMLHGNHNWPFLGVERTYRVPERMGWTAGIHSGRLNPYPHPFP